MSEQKRNRMIAAITANVILLIVILATVVIYQLVEISVVARRKTEIEQKIDYYRTEIDKNENTLDYYQSEEGLYDLAYKYGFVFGK